MDKLWIGNDQGPLVYEDETLARIAAEVACGVQEWPITRCEAMALPGAQFKLRDSLKNHMTPEEALKRLENGWIP